MKIDFTLNGQYLTKDKEIAVFYFSVWPCYIFLMNDSSEWCLSHFPFSSCTASSDNSQYAFPLCFPKIVMLGLDLDLFQFTYCVLQMKKLEQRLNELIDVIQLLNARVLLLSHVWLFATPGTVDCQTPLSMEFSRQEYWSWLLFHTPRDLLDPGTEPTSPMSSALAGRFFTTEPAPHTHKLVNKTKWILEKIDDLKH